MKNPVLIVTKTSKPNAEIAFTMSYFISAGITASVTLGIFFRTSVVVGAGWQDVAV